MTSRAPLSPSIARCALLAAIALLPACADDAGVTAPRAVVEVPAAAPADACHDASGAAQVIAYMGGILDYCFTPEVHPVVWAASAAAPNGEPCTCTGSYWDQ
jgi:hypothetical protein